MGEKLSKLQKARLRDINRARREGSATFWNDATDRSLLRRGLIERCDNTTVLGSNVSFTNCLCRTTDAGRAALSKAGE